MREDSPRWEHINPSSFDHEKQGLRELASYLPDTDPYHVWANVEFVAPDGSINEVDVLVLAPRGFYLLELKHWQGEVAGDGMRWMRRLPNGRRLPADNPYILANRKAKRLVSLIRHYARQQGRNNQVPFITAAVFLHAANTVSHLDEIGSQHVYGLHNGRSGLPSLRTFLQSPPRNPDHLITPERGQQVVELMKISKIRPSVADRRIGQLLLESASYAEGLGWQDFLARHALDESLTRRVRIYLTRGRPSDEIPSVRRAAEREFRLLQGIHHPGIAQAHDLVDHSLGPAVIFDHHQDSERLDHWLAPREEKLTVAQRLQLLQDLAEIVDYAHSRRLAHRALNPGSVYMTNPDRAAPELVVTEWQAGGRIPGTSNVTQVTSSNDQASLELFFGDEVRLYQAPEANGPHHVRGTQLDLFSLGAIAYRLFSGHPPASSPEDLAATVRDSGLNLNAAADGLPESLVKLVYDATRGDPTQRLTSVSQFREKLETVWDALTAPEPEPAINPLEAHHGDVLEGGLTVLRRLGSGGTATALLVSRETPDGKRNLVLKVARDEQYAERLAAEARVLAEVRHGQVAALVANVDQPVQVGGRTALLMDSAGEHTLAEELQRGRLALDLLERYGRDLMDIVVSLDAQAIWHRDIKPANLAARPRAKDSEQHLCMFDFSLASVPADQIRAGTVPYLDPFLGPPERPRYDAAAERFAAAVTLYEMATGTLPQWGENANPAAVSDEVTLDPGSFDPAVTERLVAFFARALARDAADRFDTAEDMAEAWRTIFRDLPKAGEAPALVGPQPARTPDSPLGEIGLTARAVSALDRLGVRTVGELLSYEPSALTRARGVPDATRREILGRIRTLRAELPEAQSEPVEGAAGRPSIEALSTKLLPQSSRTEGKINALAILLGREPDGEGHFLLWPSQNAVAAASGHAQPQISKWQAERTRAWLTSRDLERVRDEIVGLLDARGAVMSADELAAALIMEHGSYTPEPARTAQAIGLVRAAVETELARGGDARVATRRFRGSDCVLVGRQPDDPAAAVTAEEFLAAAVQLGQVAVRLAATDPLPTRQQALTELRAVPLPDGMPAPTDDRLLQIAAVASNGVADANAQGLLYPVGMPAERALRLAAANLLAKTLSPPEVDQRVRERFPRCAPLPRRPRLDDLLVQVGVSVRWDAQRGCYESLSASRSATLTRSTPATSAPLPGHNATEQAEARITDAFSAHRYLAVLTSLRQVTAARRALLDRHPLTELNVTTVLLDRLRSLGYPWETVLAADTGALTDPDYRGLVDLVRHEVVPALRDQLSVATPLLITEAAPLARYDALEPLAELADPTHHRPAARLLLVAARQPEPPLLDHVPVPHTSRSQLLWLPESWLDQSAAAPAPRTQA